MDDEQRELEEKKMEMEKEKLELQEKQERDIQELKEKVTGKDEWVET